MFFSNEKNNIFRSNFNDFQRNKLIDIIFAIMKQKQNQKRNQQSKKSNESTKNFDQNNGINNPVVKK